MSNRTYVCFECRTTERVPIQRITKNCRRCRKPAQHVYYKFSIPKRDDNAAWKALEVKVMAVNRQIYTGALARLRGDKARLERLLSETPSTREAKRRELMHKLKINAKEQQAWEQWSVA